MPRHEQGPVSMRDAYRRLENGQEVQSLILARLSGTQAGSPESARMELFEAGQLTYVNELTEGSLSIVELVSFLPHADLPELRMHLWQGRALMEARAAAGLPFRFFDANSHRQAASIEMPEQYEAYFDNYWRVIGHLETEYQRTLNLPSG